MSRHAQGDIPIGARLRGVRPAAPRLDRVRDGIDAASWLSLGPVAVYAPKGTVVLLALFVLAIPDHRAALRKLGELLRTPFGLAMGAMFLWAALSLFWTPQPVDALASLLRLALANLAGLLFLSSVLVMPGDRRPWTRRCAALGTFLIVLFLAIELVTGGTLVALFREPISDNLIYALRGTAILAVLTVPAAALLLGRARPWLAAGLIVAAAIMISLMSMFASVVALAGGLLVAAVVWLMGKRAVLAVTAAICLAGFAAPWIFTALIPPERFGQDIAAIPTSWQHRMGIWEFAGDRALQRPLLGHGYDASRVIGEEPGMVTVVSPNGTLEGKQLPLHPHNVALQLWLELGGIGVVLFAGVLLSATAVMARSERSPAARPALFGSLTAALTLMFVSYGAWQGWWHATIWIAVAACAMAISADGKETVGAAPAV